MVIGMHIIKIQSNYYVMYLDIIGVSLSRFGSHSSTFICMDKHSRERGVSTSSVELNLLFNKNILRIDEFT